MIARLLGWIKAFLAFRAGKATQRAADVQAAQTATLTHEVAVEQVLRKADEDARPDATARRLRDGEF